MPTIIWITIKYHDGMPLRRTTRFSRSLSLARHSQRKQLGCGSSDDAASRTYCAARRPDPVQHGLLLHADMGRLLLCTILVTLDRPMETLPLTSQRSPPPPHHINRTACCRDSATFFLHLACRMRCGGGSRIGISASVRGGRSRVLAVAERLGRCLVESGQARMPSFSCAGLAAGPRRSEQATIPDRIELRPGTADDSLGRNKDNGSDGEFGDAVVARFDQDLIRGNLEATGLRPGFESPGSEEVAILAVDFPVVPGPLNFFARDCHNPCRPRLFRSGRMNPYPLALAGTLRGRRGGPRESRHRRTTAQIRARPGPTAP